MKEKSLNDLIDTVNKLIDVVNVMCVDYEGDTAIKKNIHNVSKRTYEGKTSETVNVFIERTLDMTGNTRDAIPASALYKKYIEWCEDMGIMHEAVSPTTFGIAIKAAGVPSKRVSKGMKYIGIKLK